VLLVDPVEESRRAIAAFLREEGPFEVDSVTNGEEAWQKIQRSAHYHVVLLDELLPPTADASLQPIGIDLMKKLKTYRPELEAILFRAPEKPAGLKQALHAGAWRHLSKDYDPYELLTLIEHSAASRKLRQEAWSNAQRVEQLEALRRTILAITPSTEPDTLLNMILNHAVTLLQAKGGGLYKYYPEREELEILADYNRPYAIGRILKVGQGIAGKLVQTRELFRIVDDYPGSSDKVPEWPSDTVFGTLLEVTLKWQERILGVLFVGDDLGRKFTAEEAHFIMYPKNWTGD
jgi:CheY-like chemotaxis protein